MILGTIYRGLLNLFGISSGTIGGQSIVELLKAQNVIHFYEAGQGVSTSGGVVTKWKDLIGQNHLVQDAVGHNPDFTTTAWGSRAVTFDETNLERLAFTTGIDWNEKTLLFVCSNVQTGTARGIISSGSTARWIQYNGTGTTGQIFADGTAKVGTSPAGPDTTSGQDRTLVHLLRAWFSDTQASLAYNMAAGNTRTVTFGTPSTVTKIANFNSTAANNFGGNIHAIVVVDDVSLTNAQLGRIVDHLTGYYDKRPQTVKTSGGTYSTITTACAAYDVTSRFEWSPLNIQIDAGTWAEGKLLKPPFVSFSGAGNPATLIQYYQDDSTSSTDIMTNSPVDMKSPGWLRDLKVDGKNVRYAVHMETGAAPSYNFVNSDVYGFQDCTLMHSGNPSPNNTWTSKYALGIGTASGNHYYYNASQFFGVDSAVGGHDNVSFTARNIHTFSACHFEKTPAVTPGDEWNAVRFDNLGSGIYDHPVYLNDCTCPAGDFQIANWSSAWNLVDPAVLGPFEACHHFYANNSTSAYPCANISPAAIPCLSEVLRITAVANNQALSVSGSAAGVIMTNTNFPNAEYWREAPDVPAFINGALNVSTNNVGAALDTNNHKLGKRLGDCSTNNLTLIVQVGSSSATMTFNQNYTTTSNTDILTAINTALTGLAVASVVNLNNEVYRFFDTDEAQTITNNGRSSFALGDAVVLDGSVWRKATSNDVKITGICIDRIIMGARGRVLKKGYIYQQQLNYTGTNIAATNTIGVNPAVDGQLEIVSTGNVIGVAAKDFILNFNT